MAPRLEREARVDEVGEDGALLLRVRGGVRGWG